MIFYSATVPLSVIGSMKKIKSLVGNNHLLAQALRSSSKLVSPLFWGVNIHNPLLNFISVHSINLHTLILSNCLERL